MLCSSCRVQIKPIVAIDIDGTIADYHTGFIDLCYKYVGKGGYDTKHDPVYRGGPEGSFRHWCKTEVGMDDSQYEAVKLAYRQGAYKRWQHPFGGALLMFRSVMAAGAEIWVTTTRPYLRHDTVDPDTRFWLAKHGLEYDGLIYDEDKYVTLAERVGRDRVVAVLDDLPEQFDAAYKLFGWEVPILRKTLYNDLINRVPESYSLPGATEMILERIETWGAKHAA